MLIEVQFKVAREAIPGLIDSLSMLKAVSDNEASWFLAEAIETLRSYWEMKNQ